MVTKHKVDFAGRQGLAPFGRRQILTLPGRETRCIVTTDDAGSEQTTTKPGTEEPRMNYQGAQKNETTRHWDASPKCKSTGKGPAACTNGYDE